MAVVDLLSMHKQFLASHIASGGTVADFTMGNGHDTLWLAEQVGATGHVYAFDIQERALEQTKARLRSAGVEERCTLILDSHANAGQYIHEPLCASVFNLGWLPGSDRSLTTRHESTLLAVDTAIRLCSPDGIVLIAVYPGHSEGELEGKLLSEKLSSLDRRSFSVSLFRIINSPTSPFFFAVEASGKPRIPVS